MFLRVSSSALALSLAFAPGAFALTPEEVWDGWVKYYAATGYTVTEGAREVAGETMTVKDIVLTHKSDEVTVVMTLPQAVLQAAGDGKVRTTVAETMTGRVDAKNREEKPVGVDFTMTTPGAEIISSGDLDNRTDVSTMPAATIAVTKIDLPDDEVDLVNPVTLTMTDTVNEMVTEAGKAYRGTAKIAKLDYVADINHANGTFKGAGSIEGIEGGGSVMLPAGGTFDMINLAKVLNDGASFEGTLKLGASNSAFDYATTGKTAAMDGETSADAEPAKPSSGSVKSVATGGEISFRMAKDGLVYQGAATGLDGSVTDSEMPAPISYKADDASFDLQFPVSKSDTPAPFKVAYSLNNLTLGDDVWALFDPASKLPRTPASLDLDLTGLLKIKQDLFDPKAMEAAKADADTDTDTTAAEAAPFDLIEMTFNQFAVDAVGAKLSAEGTLKAGEAGIAEPIGAIKAKVEGLNGLIDTLTGMGLVPEEQVQGIRMMLALFTKPGEGTDVLTSDVEFKEGGSVFANGQQIK